MQRNITFLLIFIFSTILSTAQNPKSVKEFKSKAEQTPPKIAPDGYPGAQKSPDRAKAKKQFHLQTPGHKSVNLHQDTEKQSLQIAQDSLIKLQMQKQYHDYFRQKAYKKSQALESSRVKESDSLALVAVYNKMQGDQWTHQENWLTDQPVKDWWGVTVENNRVTEIDFYISHDSSQNLAGSFAEEIWDLTGLQFLDLSNSRIFDSIPAEIATLSNLTHLDLSHCYLQGPIPPEMGDMQNLNYLSLSWNQMSGRLPAELGDINTLSALSLEGNQFIGTIPPEFGQLDNLRHLKLHLNELRGSIPKALSNLERLQELQLSRNQLSGTIPGALGALTHLEVLNLSSNQFTGKVPVEFNNLERLNSLNISHNRLDALPDLSGLQDLRRFYLDNNAFDFKDLSNANMDWNTLDSYHYAHQAKLAKPDTVSSGDQLDFTVSHEATGNQYIWFENGTPVDTTSGPGKSINTMDEALYLCKVINKQFPQLTLETGSIYTGKLISGLVKEDYKTLEVLYDSLNGDGWLHNDHWLTDSTASHWYGISVENYRVTNLNLSNNYVTGSIPPEIGELDQLQTLNFHWNNIEGSVPSALGNLKKLTYINLSYNNLKGTIPKEMGRLENLRYLYLWSNQLSGAIPDALGDLDNLVLLSLGHNGLSGSVPSTLQNLSNLRYLWLNDNRLEELVDLSAIPDLRDCYLQGNFFSFGDLKTAGISESDMNVIKYAPQGLYPVKADTTGSTVNLTVNAESADNSYQWYKSSEELMGETAASISYSTGDTSTYYCLLQNTDYPKLTLQTSAVGSNLQNGVVKSDYGALVELFHQTNGENWVNNENWLTNEPVGRWFGVKVHGNRVMELSLDKNNLSGKLTDALAGLDKLTYLSLYRNQVSGKIPQSIGNLSNLYYLDLDENQFTGTIPASIGELTGLHELFLGWNKLEGEIPESFGNLSELETFELDSNKLTGKVPDELTRCDNIGWLNLSRNQFESLPDLSNMSNLDGLWVFRNKLTFTDLDVAGIDPQKMNDYKYAPQKPLGLTVEEQVGNEGSAFSVDIEELLLNQSGARDYLWVKNTDTIGTEQVYQQASLSASDTGDYVCYMKHDRYPDLSLMSDTLRVLMNWIPDDIVLSDTTIEENRAEGTVVGILNTISREEGDEHDFTLVSGDGINDADNNKFEIRNDTLFSAQEFDFEQNTELHVCIQTLDTAGNTYQKAFTIHVEDVDDATGIKDSEHMSLNVYPNPASGIIHLKGAIGESAYARVTITDLNGRIVYRKQLHQKQFNEVIDLQDLSDGTYILNYQLKDKTYVRKIILK